MNKIFLAILMVLSCFLLTSCQETEEGVDNEIDIIVRNFTDFDLWITVDDIQRGEVENNGTGQTVWDGIPEGDYILRAYINSDYTDLYCEVDTEWLEGDDDFKWYLEDDGDYSGTLNGHC